ncbi:MAG: 50S ribosomal protein L9 [Phycisphaerales bacterium JB037]
MARSVKLLLTENVDNLGIVGDVVNVKLGYARNFLLPRGYATTPSDEVINALAAKRAEAEKEVAALRKHREQVISKMAGLALTLERSCNDQGILYGSVTQQDIAEALTGAGYPIKPREVRLPHTIKRLGRYDIHVKLDSDLETDIALQVDADRHLEEDEREEMEFDNEGNLIERPKRSRDRAPAQAPAAEG